MNAPATTTPKRLGLTCCVLLLLLLARDSPADVRARVRGGPLPSIGPVLAGSGMQPIVLSSYLNNDGISESHQSDGNFDGVGNSFPADQLPQAGLVVCQGVPYLFPSSAPGTLNNVIAMGQTIPIAAAHFGAAYLLAAASHGPVAGTVTMTYADGSHSESSIQVPDWDQDGDVIETRGHNRANGVEDQQPARIFAVSAAADPDKVLTSITLPTTPAPAAQQPSLHVFAMTLQSLSPGVAPLVVNAYSTNEPVGDGGAGVRVTVQNLGTDWATPGNPISVSVGGPRVETVVPATISDLGPMEQRQVTVGIRLPTGDQEDGPVTTTVSALAGDGHRDERTYKLDPSVTTYAPTDASLSQHATPDWFNDAKFGIFIHWGVYSVPAWAPADTTYAEWYWYEMNQPGSPVAAHHEQTYGPNAAYDDFIPQFTAANFDPAAWARLFQDAGARYFVLTAKHHDGFALFGDRYSDRNSVALGPHRDLVKELFHAAQAVSPDLKRGLYYSLPEWYNPAYPGDGQRFPGGPPVNPFSGAPVPYTGYQPVADYVHDYQAPQMQELIDHYNPDILWCDIGGPNDSLHVLATYLNRALSSGEQVTFDDRCGVGEHDFVTQEYGTPATVMPQKWEESRGIDPSSFGYNSRTPADDYMSAQDIVHELVDVTSMNGNLLLDVGPRADGTIPQPMVDRLRAVGDWLRVNGDAIYGSTYWTRAQREQTGAEDLRFTVGQDGSFYIVDLHMPAQEEVVESPIPIRPGDHVTLLSHSGGPLMWRRVDGHLIIDVPPGVADSGQYAWTFKISHA